MFTKIKGIVKAAVEKMHASIFQISHNLLLPLRYKVEVRGVENLDPKKGGVNQSIVFLANHSSHLDATILATQIIRLGIPLSIWALDLTFKLPYLRWAARRKETIQVVKVPNLLERRSQKHVSNLHKLVTRTGDGLRKGRNFLIFPSGRVKKTPLETIDGKSAVPLIIKQFPDVKIILARITGMWGSRFSCAIRPDKRWATKSIKPWVMFLQSLKMVLLNAIFFIPKRRVLVEFMPVGNEFPWNGTRLEIDRYLERRFNEEWGPQGEPLYRVPDYFWKSSYIEHEYLTMHYSFNLDIVPKKIRNAVCTLIADTANVDVKDLNFDMDVGRDLGLDSLEIVQILTELEAKYHIAKLVPDEITTVGHLIALAGKIPIACSVNVERFDTLRDPPSLKDNLPKRIPSMKMAAKKEQVE